MLDDFRLACRLYQRNSLEILVVRSVLIGFSIGRNIAADDIVEISM